VKELDRIRGYLFWEFQYIKRQVLQFYTVEWKNIAISIGSWNDVR